ncbi:hypothetical protein [Chryseobacterium sp.]|uniref:hypothetical protein n=1 Tax=Chryseobacterium sp. TaxID=1871047 RepID=UPI002FC5D89E
MKNIKVVIIGSTVLTCFGLFSFIAVPNNFIEIYKSSDYTISSRRESSNSAWIKWIYLTKNVKDKKGKFIIVGGKQNLQLWDCDCSSKNYDIKNWIEYGRNGKAISSSQIPIYNQPVIPESVGELIFEHICANNDEYYYDNIFRHDSLDSSIDSTMMY